MIVELNVFNVSHQHVDIDDLSEVNMIENAIHDSFLSSFNDDPLEKCLTHSNMNIDENCLVNEVNSSLETIPLRDTKVETLQLSRPVMLPSIERPPQLELKPLLHSLKYVFLGPSETLPRHHKHPTSNKEQ
ncbi:hypothetical protein H7U16_25945 [Klebsiella pneumoniae]|uniref:Uncharacterized protein n=1 Tax=Klebsiella pneumoniae TaxID=573 RepID=A0A7X1HUA2_KLEPN|nr:hypothetical protein [Klebsiella pneumoniae]